MGSEYKRLITPIRWEYFNFLKFFRLGEIENLRCSFAALKFNIFSKIKFCTCAQDSYTDLCKKFRVNSMDFVCSVYVMMNWKETPPSDCEVWSVVHFLTMENNSGAKIHIVHTLHVEKRM